MLQLAKQRLTDMAFFGIAERFDESVCLLRHSAFGRDVLRINDAWPLDDGNNNNGDESGGGGGGGGDGAAAAARRAAPTAAATAAKSGGQTPPLTTANVRTEMCATDLHAGDADADATAAA